MATRKQKTIRIARKYIAYVNKHYKKVSKAYLFGSHIQEYLENKAVQEESKLREEYGTPIIIHGNTDGGIAIGDITGDGHQDVIVTTSKDGVSKLYRLINDGKGNLIPFTSARE